MSEILVGVDGTASAEDALAFARKLAGATGATLRLATAYPYDDTPSRAANQTYREVLHADAVALLEGLGEADAPKVAVADVSPAHALHVLADESDAALVVVGSTHRGPIGRVLPGSTAERLLHGATCPVAIVPHGYQSHAGDAIRTIGVGFDASLESLSALDSASDLARRFGAKLRVIRVFDATEVGTPGLAVGPAYAEVYQEVEEHQRGDLDRCVASLPSELSAEGVFLSGSPGPELAEQSHSLDLLVVGSRGYGPLRAVLLGGVSHALVRAAACPVIVLPHGVHTGLALGGELTTAHAPGEPSRDPLEH
jgi:nucleotide-binding universal stress UspA family protein